MELMYEIINGKYQEEFEKYLFRDNLINTFLSGFLGLFGLTGIDNLRNKLYKRTFTEIMFGPLLIRSYINFIKRGANRK